MQDLINFFIDSATFHRDKKTIFNFNEASFVGQKLLTLSTELFLRVVCINLYLSKFDH